MTQPYDPDAGPEVTARLPRQAAWSQPTPPLPDYARSQPAAQATLWQQRPSRSQPGPAAVNDWRQPGWQQPDPVALITSQQAAPSTVNTWQQPPGYGVQPPLVDPTARAMALLASRSRKSVLTAFFLTVFLGPFGMFYSTVPGALIMLFLAGPVLLVTLGHAFFAIWGTCIVWACVAAARRNMWLDAVQYGRP